MPYKLTFDAEKSLAATAYLAQKTGETMYPILKMLYLVDRLHLERYGRPVTGDEYVAMTEGPVPTEIYDWMKFLRGDREYSKFPAARNYLAVNPETFAVSVVQMPDAEVLSESDAECLDAVVEIYRQRDKWRIVELAHDDAWKATSKNKFMDIMTIAATLKDGPTLTQHLSERFTED